MTNTTAKINAVAQAVLDACQRQVSKNRSLDGLNLDAIVKGALTTEVFPGATAEEIASIDMQDLVGSYESPDQVPEWAWVEREASFNHNRNGQEGIFEFVLNLSRRLENIPENLKATIEQARAANMAYLIVHQGT